MIGTSFKWDSAPYNYQPFQTISKTFYAFLRAGVLKNEGEGGWEVHIDLIIRGGGGERENSAVELNFVLNFLGWNAEQSGSGVHSFNGDYLSIP